MMIAFVVFVYNGQFFCFCPQVAARFSPLMNPNSATAIQGIILINQSSIQPANRVVLVVLRSLSSLLWTLSPCCNKKNHFATFF